MASNVNVTKVAGISSWNGLKAQWDLGNMSDLDLVMGALPGAQWVQNDRLRGSFLALNPHVLGGFSGMFMASNVTKVAVISGWNGLDG